MSYSPIPLKRVKQGSSMGVIKGHTWSFRLRVYLMKNGMEHGR